MYPRPLAFALVASSVLGACGGRSARPEGTAPLTATGTTDGGVGGTDASLRGDAELAYGDAGATADAADSAPVCVDVDPSTYDLSCTTNRDCIVIASGSHCDDDCLCPDTAINMRGQARYEQTIAPLLHQGLACSCPNETPPCCLRGQCALTGCSHSTLP